AERPAQLGDLGPGLPDVAADAGAGLHHRLVHLRPDALAEQRVLPPVLEELAHVRAQLAGLGVNDLELFLDAQGELAVEETLRCGQGLPLHLAAASTYSRRGRLDMGGEAPQAPSPSSRMKVGPAPAPAWTLHLVVAESRVSTPRVSPRKR